MAEWQTRRSQKPVKLKLRVGSTPTFGTDMFRIEGTRGVFEPFELGLLPIKISWVNDSWEILNAVFERIRRRPFWSRPQRPEDFWGRIESHPLTPAAIQKLVSDGLGLRILSPESELWGAYLPPNRICLKTSLKPYERDKTLFHELCHAMYRQELVGLNDRLSAPPSLRQENEIIVEWLARQFRADPQLLREAINIFDLEPKVYDWASYQAFPGYRPFEIDERQFALPFAAWEIHHRRRVLRNTRKD